jgi:hypothetical protein
MENLALWLARVIEGINHCPKMKKRYLKLLNFSLLN